MEKTIKELLEFSIINVDKSAGPTSFGVDSIIKKMLGARKTSHFGTLDPKVTGVLPIALNRACKLTGFFMKKDKTYVGIMHLHENVDDKKLKREVKKFVGKIIQKPPVKSRVKREEREREVKRFEILERVEKDVLFEAEVEAGTYIRKLISDLGEKIGGAHMLELRRIKAGIFDEKDKNFVDLYELEKAVEEYEKGKEEKLREILIPAEEAIKKIIPIIQVKKKVVSKLLTGKPIFKEDVIGELKEKEGLINIFCEGKFIGIYKIIKEKNIIARPEFVFN